MTTFVFSSIDELLNKAKKDGACRGGLMWVKNQSSLNVVFKDLPFHYRRWCLKRGYSQFEKDCDWKRFNGYGWVLLIFEHPHLSSYRDWETDRKSVV